MGLDHDIKEFLVLGIILVSVLVTLPAFATISLDSQIRLSDDTAEKDSQPAITAVGSNVYVTWYNGTTGAGDILFKNSTDGGSTFPAGREVGDAAISNVEVFPQIAVYRDNVHIVWSDGTDKIHISTSTDNGVTNDTAAFQLDADTTKSIHPDVAISDFGHVYVVWMDEDPDPDAKEEIMFRVSSDNGTTFAAQQILEDNAVAGAGTFFDDPRPQVATSDDYVHVVWQNSTDIVVRSSADNGTNFSDAVDIANVKASSSNDRTLPQIASSGSGKNVFVTFINNTGSDDVYFTRSTNFGVDFSDPISLGVRSAGPSTQDPSQLLVSGDNVYVVWADGTDNDDIQFRRITNNGATIESQITLSSSSAFERDPKVAVSGTNVYVVWTHTTAVAAQISSSNQGGAVNTFTRQSLSGGTAFEDPAIAASGNSVFLAWEDTTDGGLSNIFYKTGNLVGADIRFDLGEYKLGSIANVTITDSTQSGQGTISVNVTSTTTPAGNNPGNYTLTEHENQPGFFTKLITLSEDTTSGTSLKVSAGDTLNAFFGGNGAQAKIFDRVVSFNGITQFDRGSFANVTVTDQNSNLLSGTAETVEVTITTDADSSGSVKLTLTETGVDTGIFGGFKVPTNSTLIFTVGDDLVQTSQTITVSQEEVAGSGTFVVQANTTSTPGGINLSLTETSEDSGDVSTSIYSGTLTLSTASGSSNSGTGTIEANNGDFLTIKNPSSGLIVNTLITPNPNDQNDAIQVNLPSDTVVATYKDASFSASVINANGESGGGGGGLVRPSLVVNIIAGAVAGGGGSGKPVVGLNALLKSSFIDIPDEIEQALINFDSLTPLKPYDVTAEQFEEFDFPLSIDNNGYALASYSNTLITKTLNTGEATKIKTVFYMPFELEHVAFYTNMREGDTLDDSDTFLRFYKSKPDQFQIKDENGFFEYINHTIEEDGLKKTVTFDMKFLKPMPKSDIVLRMWDKDLHSTTVLIFDAIEVVGLPQEPIEEPAPEDLEIPEPGTTVPETSELKIESKIIVPDWIRTNAKWWNNEQISDTDFARGIEYLIENNILKVPQTETFEQEQVQEIPGWIKNNAGWWGDGLLSDQDFVNGIQWLIKNGIMKIQINS